MTEAQFELLLAAIREQHNELRAIHEAALGKLRGISYALFPSSASTWSSSPGWPEWLGSPCEMSPGNRI